MAQLRAWALREKLGLLRSLFFSRIHLHSPLSVMYTTWSYLMRQYCALTLSLLNSTCALPSRQLDHIMNCLSLAICISRTPLKRFTDVDCNEQRWKPAHIVIAVFHFRPSTINTFVLFNNKHTRDQEVATIISHSYCHLHFIQKLKTFYICRLQQAMMKVYSHCFWKVLLEVEKQLSQQL